jgi:hypothetical protein
MKIHSVGAELLNADWQTDRRKDMTKLIAAIRNFANASFTQQDTVHGCIIAAKSHLGSKGQIIPVEPSKTFLYCSIQFWNWMYAYFNDKVGDGDDGEDGEIGKIWT